MAEGEDDDKQFEASQKKLDDARKKGELAKSADLGTAAAYGGFLVVAVSVGAGSLMKVGETLSIVLGQAHSIADVTFSGSPSPFMGGLIWDVITGLAPWFLGPAVFVILSILAQKSFVVAPTKIAPKANRISIISGFKNKFGRAGLFEFFKSFAKLLIYSVILGVFLSSKMDALIAAVRLSPGMLASELGRLTVGLMLIVLIVSLVLGGIDYMWQVAEHLRKNRMSHKDMKEEHKQSEGDPAMKQQRRQRAYEIANNRMLDDVPEADVIMVNPTHYAVALKWDKTAAVAPMCVAKGVDEIAAKIREIAAESAIPIYSDPPATRAIYATVPIGAEIEHEHYKPVAAAIRFSERIRKEAGRL